MLKSETVLLGPLKAIRWLALGMLLTAWAITAAAQSAGKLTLDMSRDWGFADGSQMQGRFSLIAQGPTNLVSVTFKIDDAPMKTVTQPPFKLQFDTGAYAVGWHTLVAVGQDSQGRTLTSNSIRAQFISAEEAWAATKRVLIPMLSVIGGVVLVIFGVLMWLALRDQKSLRHLGATRGYGFWGGAICPKCGRPFAISMWGINMGLSKYRKCPYCGQRSWVRRESPEKLAEAEAATQQREQAEKPAAGLSAEEKLRHELDDSRFEEGT